MTDVVALAKRLFGRLRWQSVPDTITQDDLTDYIAEAIRYLYVITGRALELNEEMFTYEENGLCVAFENKLEADEIEYVLLTAQIDFLRTLQGSVDELTSYTTDAMAVTHGDKPFANLQKLIEDAESNRTKIWYKMIRFHLL